MLYEGEERERKEFIEEQNKEFEIREKERMLLYDGQYMGDVLENETETLEECMVRNGFDPECIEFDELDEKLFKTGTWRDIR